MMPSASEHPPTWKFDYPIHHAESIVEWRAWLEQHHDNTPGVWLCSWRTPTNGSIVPYAEAVEQAICFGWIDSTVNVLDDDRRLQLFTPRRAKSQWTRLNRRRAAEMEAAGQMTDAGRRAIAAAQGNGWWTISDSVEDLIEPAELTAALDANPRARGAWDGFPPHARKMMLWWLVTAVKDETRGQRVKIIVEKAAEGRRAQG